MKRSDYCSHSGRFYGTDIFGNSQMFIRTCLSIVTLMASGYATVSAAFAEPPRAEIAITDAWVRPPSRLSPEARAYFTITNSTDAPERLVGVSSRAGEASLMLFHPGLNPYAEKLKFIEILPDHSLRLNPTDYFVLLKGLDGDLRPGQTLALTIRLQKAGARDVNAVVTNQLLGNLGRPKAP